ncbi:hypothetical protein DH2020_011734 [Rehmannia glutinosa]|uniref:Kinesin motor domain-containing protein n=1 Tax=Rehmannia glutinosa TaxID=99300 RepID=A0ABR0XEW9_REHGL
MTFSLGRSVLGFSLTSPDLVCMGSPDIANQRYEESPEFLKGGRIDVSLENGIEGSEIGNSFKTSASKIEDLCTEASFELVAPPLNQENLTKVSTTIIGINVGSTLSVEFQGGLHFSEDGSFSGGDTVRTDDPIIGDSEGLSLYQTARFGNFSYYFKNLESGIYIIELHFAEIVFTDGPPGMRIFDVFLQGQKDNDNGSIDGEFQRLQTEHALQKKELSDTRRVLEELKRDHELKNRECQEAWKSLKDLQNELMRKSMHVGSLGEEILKMEHISLSEDASLFRQYLAEMEGVKSIVQSTRNIRVFCRCRPLNTEEIDGGTSVAVDFEAAKDGELTVKSNGISKKTFKFDAVFSPEADQCNWIVTQVFVCIDNILFGFYN